MQLSQLSVAAVILVALIVTPSRADEPFLVSRAMKEEMVDSICGFLMQSYVFEDQAARISKHLRSRHKKGAYDSISAPEDLADALTKDLQSVNQDRHLQVVFAPEFVAAMRADTGGVSPERARAARNENFGFYKLERLPGNVGYLDLRGFESTSIPGAGEVAVAAMQVLAHSRAIIIDLRKNRGGTPEMIQLLSSYLFDEKQHLNDLRSRPERFTRQYWTLPHVPGRRMPDIPVYVLTSHMTFSAGEEFANNLRELKRATIVGETTRGGAHAGEGTIINDYLGMFLPTDEAINPVSKSNWEGVGVQPHIAVAADSALDIAHIHALETLIEATLDEREGRGLRAALERARAQALAIEIPADRLASYVGAYGIRTISLEKGSLYFRREQGARLKLLPVSQTSFVFESQGGQVTFLPDDAGAIVGLELVRALGDTIRALRTE